MITLGEKEYKLCLLDTNAISELLRNKLTIGKNIATKFLNEGYLFCYAIQTIGELLKAPDIFDEFFEYINILPSFLLKNYNQLLDDEIKSYPAYNLEKPFLFAFTSSIYSDFNAKMKTFIQAGKMRQFFENEENDRLETLDSILNAAKEWPPDNGQYTKKEIEEWAEIVVWKHLMLTDRKFFDYQYKNLNHIIDYRKFQSWLMISYVAFYKYYLNKMRRPKLNDINDILITCALPYIDAIISENDLCEILRQIQVKHNFIKNLEIMKLKDFKY